MSEISAHWKSQICTISKKNRHNPIDMASTTATTTITAKQKEKDGGGLLLLKSGQKISVEEIYILPSYYFIHYIYTEENVIIQSIPNKWIRYECSACLNFWMRKFSLASDLNAQSSLLKKWGWNIAVAFILRRHHYTQGISLDTRILTRDSIIIIDDHRNRVDFCKQKCAPANDIIWFGIVCECSYSLPLPGAYHADELVNIWRAWTLHSLRSLTSVRCSGQFYWSWVHFARFNAQ